MENLISNIELKELKKYINIYWFRTKLLSKKNKNFLDSLPEYIKVESIRLNSIRFWPTTNTSKDSLERFGEFFEVKVINSKEIIILVSTLKTTYHMGTEDREEVDEIVTNIFYGKCDLEKFEEDPGHNLGADFYDRLQNLELHL